LYERSTRNFRAGLGSTLATASHHPIKTLYDTSTIRLQQCRIHSQSRLLRLQPCRTHSQSHHNALQPHLPSCSTTLYDPSTVSLYGRVTKLCNRSTVSSQCSTTGLRFHCTALHRSTTLYDASTVFLERSTARLQSPQQRSSSITSVYGLIRMLYNPCTVPL